MYRQTLINRDKGGPTFSTPLSLILEFQYYQERKSSVSPLRQSVLHREERWQTINVQQEWI